MPNIEANLKEERHGSPTFYALLREMSDIHNRKSHDYASNDNPYGNYEFAGQVASMFAYSPSDAGFLGRVAEKLYRIKNLEDSGKTPKNEDIEETEKDIAVIICLWIANRRDRRKRGVKNLVQSELLDLITLMPKSQTDEIVQYITSLNTTREKRDGGSK